MASSSPTGAPAPLGSITKRMEVDNLTFLLERLNEDCSPLQFLRELTQNSIEAIQNLSTPEGEVVWDVEWNRYDLTGVYKLSIVDTGIGMTGEEMVQYINALSSSIQKQSRTGNYGVGAKIAAAPNNPQGLVYLSWKNGVGSMIHLWKDPETDEYGLRPLEVTEDEDVWWAPVDDILKPDLIDDHGTMVVLLGEDDEHNTMEPPPGTATPSQWISRYLNTRYFRFPEGVTVKARQGWEFPRSNKDSNVLRTVQGQEAYLNQHSEASGIVELTGAKAHWWVLKDEPALTQNSGFIASSGHAAALYQDELYEMVTGRAGAARLQQFGVIFGYKRVVLYVEPETEDERLTSNTARTQLLMDGEPLPWTEWSAEFREQLPEPIEELVSEVAGHANTSDYRDAIRERLRAIWDLLRLSRYRRTPRGSVMTEEDTAQGGEPAPTGTPKGKGSRKSGGRGGRAGDVYSLFLATEGVPAEELDQPEPQTTWVTVENGTREPPDLEDRAAKYLLATNRLLINADFRVFQDMTKRWAEKYQDTPGAEKVAENVVREWFEQQLIEAVMGVQSLRGSSEWSLVQLEQAWSEEALTAAVMPRYHVNVAVKRALGAKLGSLKDRKGVA